MMRTGATPAPDVEANARLTGSIEVVLLALLKLGSVGYRFIRYDWRDHLGGTVARRSLVVGSLMLGAVLAIAMLPFPTPFALPSGGG